MVWAGPKPAGEDQRKEYQGWEAQVSLFLHWNSRKSKVQIHLELRLIFSLTFIFPGQRLISAVKIHTEL